MSSAVLPPSSLGPEAWPVQGLTLGRGDHPYAYAHCAGEVPVPMASQRSPHWVNSQVLLEAIERYEQGRLARPLQLWLQGLLEINPKDPPAPPNPPG